MDRMLYVAMGGAKQILTQQAATAHNLANVATHGYRAETHAFRVAPIQGDGLPTRAHVVDASTGTDFSQGPLQQTGRDLDVAIQGEGWFAVQTPSGGEAYTRSGNFQTDSSGALVTSNGMTVLGDGGPITLPSGANVVIAKDGTVSAVPSGQSAVQVVGRLKLVNPPAAELQRGDDGLFRMRNGANADTDASVSVASGALEGSNVNVVEAMVNMIALSRSFEMHMKFLENAEANDRQASTVLTSAR
jgi:flagellar basal-body rod protein FlgF